MTVATAITWFDANYNQSPSGATAPSALMSSRETQIAQYLEAKWNHIDSKLTALQQLTDDWDGLGASAPNLGVIHRARAFSARWRKQQPATPPSRVLAAPDGSVVFEWQDNSMILEVEINEPGRAHYTLEEPGKPPRFWTEPFEVTSRDATWATEGQSSPAAA